MMKQLCRVLIGVEDINLRMLLTHVTSQVLKTKKQIYFLGIFLMKQNRCLTKLYFSKFSKLIFPQTLVSWPGMQLTNKRNSYFGKQTEMLVRLIHSRWLRFNLNHFFFPFNITGKVLAKLENNESSFLIQRCIQSPT